MARGQQRDHLFDLHNLLGGTAEKAEQRLAEGLAREGEAWKGGQTAGEMAVTAPRESIGQRGKIAAAGEINRQGLGHAGLHGRGGGPFKRAGVRRSGQAKTGNTIRPNALPRAVPGLLPTERLAAIKSLGEHGGCERRQTGQGLPVRPERGGHGPDVRGHPLLFAPEKTVPGAEFAAIAGEQSELPGHRLNVLAGPVAAGEAEIENMATGRHCRREGESFGKGRIGFDDFELEPRVRQRRPGILGADQEIKAAAPAGLGAEHGLPAVVFPATKVFRDAHERLRLAPSRPDADEFDLGGVERRAGSAKQNTYQTTTDCTDKHGRSLWRTGRGRQGRTAGPTA